MPNRRDVVAEQLDELRTDFEALWVALTRDPKKEARKERAWTIFAGAAGAAAALAARKLATQIWVVLTGEVPPPQQRRRPPQKV
ncbi:MAG TPA: DUF4235 domain-containing protein [Gaiellaceae bacterium]|nr:DUF4235 domain-containing protein [Gaiellaceae bacterium]